MAKYTVDDKKKYVESAKLENIIIDGLNSGKFGYDAVEILSEIYMLESADVAPVVHGKWILGEISPDAFTPGGNRPWICSECNSVMSFRLEKPNEEWCPNCGAKMDLED